MFTNILSLETEPNTLVMSDDGVLYGTTEFGGLYNNGTLFKYDSNEIIKFTTLVHFTGVTGEFLGSRPNSLIMSDDGILYGTTLFGGASDLGTLFKYDFNEIIKFHTLGEFNVVSEPFLGENPNSVIISGGILYGTTLRGSSRPSTVFKYDFNESIFNTLVEFTGVTGEFLGNSANSLVMSGGILYGTCAFGGASDLGTLFKYDFNENIFNTLVEFTGETGPFLGENPTSLIMSDGGVLYGSTIFGGNLGFGTVFKYDFNKIIKFNTLVECTGSENLPRSLVASNDVLYGITEGGGPANYGTLFRFDSTFNNLLEFTGVNGDFLGSRPNSLIMSGGILYGTTRIGGTFDEGTIFKYSLSNSVTCFKEDTRILTKEGYKPVQDLKKGDLVKTLLHEFLPIHMIGKQSIKHEALSEHTKNQLYSGPNELVVTGCHSILVDSYANKEQCDRSRDVNSGLFQTDKKYRLPACVDDRFKVYDVPGTYTVYHLALENDNMFTNYGIYANDLLVESCSKNYLLNRSNMIIL